MMTEDEARQKCKCGHTRAYHQMRDDDGVILDGRCEKCDWGLSRACFCEQFELSERTSQ